MAALLEVLASKPVIGKILQAGPWAILACALVAYILLGRDGALSEKLDAHIAKQDVQVLLLRIICTGVADTEPERVACREAGK